MTIFPLVSRQVLVLDSFGYWTYPSVADPAGNSGTIQLDGTPTTVYRSVVTITATKTIALLDLGTYQYCTNTAAITLSIPLNSTAAFAIGSEVEIKKGGAGSLSVAVISGVTLLGDGGTTVTTPFTLTKGATIKKVAPDSWVLEGA